MNFKVGLFGQVQYMILKVHSRGKYEYVNRLTLTVISDISALDVDIDLRRPLR